MLAAGVLLSGAGCATPKKVRQPPGAAAIGVGASGSFQTEIPILVPAYRNLEPRLSLSYDSAVGNGAVGVGWHLAGPSEVRRLSPGKGTPRFDATDQYLLDGAELVACDATVNSPSCRFPPPAVAGRSFVPYATRSATPLRVAFESTAPGGQWHVWRADGTHLTYLPARVRPSGATSWSLATVEDTSGAVVRWQYVTGADENDFEAAQVLDRITYAGVTIRLHYAGRDDVETRAVGGSLIASRQLLKAVGVSVGATLVRAYALQYGMASAGTGRSRLTEVTQHGAGSTIDETTGIVTGSALPPVRLRYPEASGAAWVGDTKPVAAPAPAPSSRSSVYRDLLVEHAGVGQDFGPIATGDVNGDGRTDWLAAGFVPNVPGITVITVLANPAGSSVVRSVVPFEADPELESAPENPKRVYLTSLDLNGDGRADLVFAIGYSHEVGAGAPLFEKVALLPALSLGDGTYAVRPALRTPLDQEFGRGLQFCRPGDVDGDGRADLACTFARPNAALGQDESFLLLARSTGNGGFDATEAQLPFHAGGGLRSFAVADHDRDGRGDLLFIDYRGADLDALQGGDLSAPLRYDVVIGRSRGGTASDFDYTRLETDWVHVKGTERPELVAADVNGDGRPDLLAFQHGAGGKDPVAILTARSQPDGSLALNRQAVPAALSTIENLVTVGDVDGDGRDDLLVASRQPPGTACGVTSGQPHAALTRVRSAGDGTFALPAAWGDCATSTHVTDEWSRGLRSQALYAADVNGDDLADFLLASNASVAGAVVLHDDVSASAGLDVQRWIPVDVTGDGRRDLVHVHVDGNQTHVESLLQQGDGGFVHRAGHLPPDPFLFGRPVVRGWKLMDVNGDGRADLVYVHCAGSPAGGAGCILEVEAFVSRGDGSWSARRPQRFVWPDALADAPAIIAMDVDGDGRDDLVHLQGSTGAGPGSLRLRVLRSVEDPAPVSEYDTRMFADTPAVDVAGLDEEDTLGWRPMDVDGDGRTDLVKVTAGSASLTVRTVFARGGGAWAASISPPLAVGPATGWADLVASDARSWRAADVNGDGKADLVHLARSPGGLRVHVLLSTGSGWLQHPAQPQDVALDASALRLLGDTDRWQVADLNGDGRADLVHHRRSPALRVDALVATGDGGWRLLPPETVGEAGDLGEPDGPTWRIAELDGDGRMDLVRLDRAAGAQRTLVVSTVRSRRPLDVLTRVTSELGGTTDVEYAPAARYDRGQPERGCGLPLGVGFQLVSTITQADGRTARASTTSLGYGCPRWSPYHRTFLGHEEVMATGARAPNRPVVRQLSRYRLTDQCLTQLEDSAFLDDAGQHVGSRSMVAHDAPGATPSFDCAVLYAKRIEYGFSAATLNADTSFTHDEFGNAVRIVELGALAQAGDERTIRQSFKPAVGPWIVGLPWQETIEDGDGTGGPRPLLRSKFFCYDGDNGSDFANCGGLPSKGQLTAIQRVDDQGLYVRSTFLYDAAGNLAVVQDPRHFGTATTYDPAQHLHPTSVTNALSQTTWLTWTTDGQLDTVTDPNGVVTDHDYDEFGRLKQVTRTNRATVWREYLDWGDPAKQRIRERVDDGSPDGLWSDTYLDGLGRPYLLVRKGATPGATTRRRTTYGDASAAPMRQTSWSSPDVVLEERFDYDVPGRLVRQTHPDGTFVAFQHDTDGTRTWVKVTDERQHDRTVYRDGLGRLAGALERDRQTGQVASATYRYDAADDLVKIVDPNGNETSLQYDLLGRLRRLDDPDLGRRTYEYDLSGNVKTQTDASNRTISWTHDPLGRPTTKTYPDRQVVTWTYDEPNHGFGIGRLTSVADLSGSGCARSESLSYNEAGQVTSQTRCIEGTTFTTGFGYDLLSRLEHVTYPDQETVTHGYDAAGALDSISGYVTRFDHDKDGRLDRIQYANGTETRLTYHPTRPWLATQTVRQGSGVLYDATYAYEPNGLVRSTSSTTNRMNLVHVHDDLGRLVSTSGDVVASYRYDPAGSMTFNSLVGMTYGYPAQGPGGCPAGATPHPCATPHAPSSVWPLELRYTPNGNLSSVVDVTTQAARGIDWTFDDQPEVMSTFDGVVTTHRYDHAGVLAFRSRGGDTQRFFNPYVDHSSSRGLAKNYRAGATLVARKEGGVTRFHHADLLGSIRLVTDATGAVIARQDFDPFGGPLPAAAAPATPFRFGGNQADADNGLVYMGARFYDPRLAQFISADTLVPDPTNTQALNRYAYAYDSPASYVDPTGHEPVGVTSNYGSTFDAGGFSFSFSYSEQAAPVGAGHVPPLVRAVDSLVTGQVVRDAGVDPTRDDQAPRARRIDDLGIQYDFPDTKAGWSEFHKAERAIRTGMKGSTEFAQLMWDLRRAGVATQISLARPKEWVGEANAKVVDLQGSTRKVNLISIVPSGAITGTYLLLRSPRSGGYLTSPDGGSPLVLPLPTNFETTLFHEFGHIRGALRSDVPVTSPVGPEHPINVDAVWFMGEGYRVFNVTLTHDQEWILEHGLHPPGQ